jgi:hypothetical protein
VVTTLVVPAPLQPVRLPVSNPPLTTASAALAGAACNATRAPVERMAATVTAALDKDRSMDVPFPIESLGPPVDECANRGRLSPFGWVRTVFSDLAEFSDLGIR